MVVLGMMHHLTPSFTGRSAQARLRLEDSVQLGSHPGICVCLLVDPKNGFGRLHVAGSCDSGIPLVREKELTVVEQIHKGFHAIAGMKIEIK